MLHRMGTDFALKNDELLGDIVRPVSVKTLCKPPSRLFLIPDYQRGYRWIEQ